MCLKPLRHTPLAGKTGWHLVELTGSLITGVASAAEKSKQGHSIVEPLGAGQVVQVVLGLLLVLLVIALVAWIMKRVGSLQSMGQGVIRPLSVMSVGQRERLVLVQVGTEQLLLGVAPGSITCLHQLSDTVSVTQPAMSQGFADLMTRFRKSASAVTTKNQK